jgi:cell division protease FtsH
MPEAPKPKKPDPMAPAPFNWRPIVGYLLVSLFMLWLWQDMYNSAAVQTIPYSAFKERLAKREVTKCEILETEINGEIVPKVVEKSPGEVAKSSTAATKSSTTGRSATAAETKPVPPPLPPVGTSSGAASSDAAATAQNGKAEGKAINFRTIRVEDPKLVEDLQAAGVQFAGVRPSFLSTLLLSWILPLGAMFLLWSFLSRRIGAAGQAVMRIGKSNAKLVADKETGVTFDDVAGCDEAKFELQEVVDFLKTPDRYSALGAKIPKGVLLVGPPGTGKTLLARAVAGEAHVPFFSISGSEFVEMFVGVGAARVRDLFEQAKAQAPCIIFIDELDAIGRERGVHMGAVNDEREQTLNQLLVEMDGFQANVGVILLAATNRPEVLDRALLRPGRFDRQVIVDSPDLDGREAILKVHARRVPLAPDVNLRKIAQGTPGFSGADLANAINEAALAAARRGAHEVTQRDLEDAVEKVVAGPERKSRRLNDEEKRRVAYHETGHALVGAHSQYADPVQKISIVPRGRAALGYTLQTPTGEQFLLTRSALIDRIKGMLGGRAAEDICFGEISTGAENDLEHATAVARQMICMFGMSDSIGLVHCAERQGMFLGRDGSIQRDCSEATASKIDEEVKRLLDTCYAEAKKILLAHREQLDVVARELLRSETLDAARFQELIGRSSESKLVPAAISAVSAPASS